MTIGQAILAGLACYVAAGAVFVGVALWKSDRAC